MVTTRIPIRGGFNKPVQLSLWIQGELAGGRETWSNELYEDYKKAVQSTPLKARARKTGRPRVGGKRRVISYEGFRTYIYLLHRIGLIEYITKPLAMTEPQFKRGRGQATAAANPNLLRRNFFHAVPGRLSDPAWANPWQYYQTYGRLSK